METNTQQEFKWWDEFPAPKSHADSISRENVFELLRQQTSCMTLLVDVRRADHEVRGFFPSLYHLTAMFVREERFEDPSTYLLSPSI
jgi:hypothetical protein